MKNEENSSINHLDLTELKARLSVLKDELYEVRNNVTESERIMREMASVQAWIKIVELAAANPETNI